MTKYEELREKVKRLFVGIDLHRQQWHVTIVAESEIVFSGSIPGTWEALRQLLDRYRGIAMTAVYEAGYFGYWLHDRLVEYGVDCIVTPPSLIPQEYGNRVKTDRRDSRKLAWFLSKGLLKSVWVPSLDQRYHRQVLRRRQQLVQERIRVQNRIKAELRFHGIEIPGNETTWSRLYLNNLRNYQWSDRWMQESFQRLLDQYRDLQEQIAQQTKLLRELAESEPYQDSVMLLTKIPSIGVIGAMSLLLELFDVSRFRHAEHIAAYVGLTPSQYSSADHIRMGRITGVGKNALRALLVEASWTLIRKDPAMAKIYDRIKVRAGAKRAIVAVARHLVIRIRRILLDRTPYQVDFSM